MIRGLRTCRHATSASIHGAMAKGKATQRPQATVRVILVFGPGQFSWSPRPAQAGFVLWSEFLQLGEIFCPD
ncbi:unnamed protein product [Prunus armeniaca]